MRPSYFAMLYLQQKGYRMIPVNPRYAGQQILGETVVASLDDLPAPPDMVQVFRKAEEAPAVVDEAIRAGAKVVWLQLGIRSDEAAAKARRPGWTWSWTAAPRSSTAGCSARSAGPASTAA